MLQRKITRTAESPLRPGFLGQGHRAAAIIDGNRFEDTDPFILLMDDQLDLPGGEPVGGAHPHAGFETVTLVLEGDGKHFETGSLEVMTAGKGIVHTEEITAKTKMRILQLWLVLPPEKRWAEPFLQKLLSGQVPTKQTADSEIRVYSGSSNSLQSPLSNQTPFTLVEFRMTAGAEITQELPATYNGFIYVLEGSVWIGDRLVKGGTSAWFDRSEEPGESSIRFKGAEERTHFILYAGEPQKAPIVSHGPFIADTREDIVRLYQEYRSGLIPHLNDLPGSRKVTL